MATGTVYLDVDDEITSAAARIRGSEATKVALVVPYGSRIATSRMNFRLLSREAIVNNRRLSIVATDPATRALAASAGLPVFANVAEWDAAGEAGGTSGGAGTASTTATDEPAGPTAGGQPVITSRSRKRPTPPGDEPPTLGLAPAAGAAGGAAAVGTAAGPASAASASAASASAPSPFAPPAAAFPPARPAGVGKSRIPVVRGRSLPQVDAPVVAIAAALVLALVVAAVGAYLFLPSAEVAVTPREEPISLDLVIRADPDVTAPDPTSNVVPALILEIPIQLSETFDATDKRVEEEPATGRVVFESYNSGSTNTIARGSIVATEGGIRFRTTAAVTLPRAQVIPPATIEPSSRMVGVVAVKPGSAGNVPANAIRVVPAGEDPTVTKVRNPADMAGGTHEEFPRISKDDADAAMASLQAKVTEAFEAALAGGAGAPANATLFSETAVLGDATPSVDPATLVGKELPSFELGLSATGTVVAVDSSPVTKIAETRLLANVGPDHRLVEGSTEVVPGDPTVSNGEVAFPVTARAARVRILDPADLLALIKGRSVEDARTLLAEFGDVAITPWPDWVTTIPGIDSRVTIEIVGQTSEAGDGSQRPSGSTVPSPRPTGAASAAP